MFLSCYQDTWFVQSNLLHFRKSEAWPPSLEALRTILYRHCTHPWPMLKTLLKMRWACGLSCLLLTMDTVCLQEDSGLAILLTLLNEVFDVSVGDQWLRRQLSVILRQLLASAVSDKMGRRIAEVLDSYSSAERITDTIAQMRWVVQGIVGCTKRQEWCCYREALWPSGYLTEARKPCSQETKLLMALLARSKLIGSVPDDLRRLLGPATTSNGISR